MGHHKPAQRRAVGVADHRSLNRVGFPILHANHRRLAERPARALDLLAVVLVLLFAPHVGFINFDWTGERRGVVRPSFPNPVGQMPGGFLCNAQIAVQLHAGRSLDAGRQQVERQRPGLKTQV